MSTINLSSTSRAGKNGVKRFDYLPTIVGITLNSHRVKPLLKSKGIFLKIVQTN